MHPAMAVWIWSLAMMRAWQGPLSTSSSSANEARIEHRSRRERGQPALVMASNYLHSEIPLNPLPDSLLDRLADLYWTERDAELAI